ncbi:DUF5994 family protein [Catelliglobosispora koreensis]|uniref:DUF5994 family protein n=1 Tax=Catelliglobosispora koreensis TaxID=129052 RepID=UPI0012F981CD|nr:DUF5994 family protein [Catelliglobosispora koreensis]
MRSSDGSALRLLLAEKHVSRAVLDGGWWPRTWDPEAELPGLIVALSARYGPVRQMQLSGNVWQGRIRRLAAGGLVVRLGWFNSMDPALLVALTERGDQVDLLVVPPSTPQPVAEEAMKTAASSGNLVRAPQILSAKTIASREKAVWDNEGGSTTVASR